METIIQILARELDRPEQHIENIITLLDEGNTVPFIARYRKELHGSMDDQLLRELADRLQYLRNLQDRRDEVKQAIEMCTIYRDILSSTMDGFSSVISNNANDTMKVLTSLTLVLSIPTLIASIWGMNVAVPFEQNAWGFWVLLGASLVASIISIIILSRRKML